jgi:divalent metal cation (Fe/Co/Zn/Cd) transporter
LRPRDETMTEVIVPLQPDVLRRILRIQVFTLIWMGLEAAVSLSAAWRAHSPALLAFGGDSAIELVSALVVYWRFRFYSADMKAEKFASRIAGGLLFVLGAFVLLASGAALLGRGEAHSSLAGIALLLVASVVMPWLAGQKRKLSARASSAALRADAAESAVCGYMAWIALAGLTINAVWGIKWADPVAALCLIPIIVHEGWEVVKGKSCECN